MFLCNTSAIQDWSYFLSHILPLINKTSRLVHRGIVDQAEEAATTTMVTVLEPHLNSNHTSGMEHVFQVSYSESDLLYSNSRAPPGDSLPLPKAVLYLVVVALVVVAVAYAVVGHLVKDLLPDFVDCRFFGACRAVNGSKSDINCIAKEVNNMNDTSERPLSIEMNYITHNHSDILGATAKPEEIILTVEETLQVPCDLHNGT
ncbi:hypothetical protein DPEC_G00338820 [Dallia pectoralis]|uniref:Uncharacterized protein n=1 Tax=Dallia pectoralis TaxID=75939 RepID=A0ACC2F4P1_DALPE|nr:hypothetical protein DPEC_G00338820 [Dallia pectoralis]